MDSRPALAGTTIGSCVRVALSTRTRGGLQEQPTTTRRRRAARAVAGGSSSTRRRASLPIRRRAAPSRVRHRSRRRTRCRAGARGTRACRGATHPSARRGLGTCPGEYIPSLLRVCMCMHTSSARPGETAPGRQRVCICVPPRAVQSRCVLDRYMEDNGSQLSTEQKQVLRSAAKRALAPFVEGGITREMLTGAIKPRCAQRLCLHVQARLSRHLLSAPPPPLRPAPGSDP